jgi:hypothetical protein
MVLGKVGRGALVVGLLGCGACAEMSQGQGPREQARGMFSRDAFCPEPRVSAERVIPMPVAPPAIANDPERFAMWERTHEKLADQDPRQTIAVSGCGEQTTYACWPVGGWVEGRRHRQRVTIGYACIGTGPEAASNVPPGPPAPREPQDGTSRSTTEDEQPKTTASSK